MPPLAVFETATTHNFNPDAYLLANHDVKAAGMTASVHFEHFAEAEGRQQISQSVLGGSTYRRQKFDRFRSVFSVAVPQFPAFTGNRHFEISEYEAESANDDAEIFTSALEADPEGLYLDIGCGLRRNVYPNCLYLEVYPSVTADVIVSPDAPYPFKDASFDGIGCFAVLEHVRKPWKVVDEIVRILKPGGRVFIDWPFLQPVHGYPSHYFNATRQGLVSVFEDVGLKVETAATKPHQMPDSTVSWVLGKLIERIPAGDIKEAFLSLSVRELAAMAPGSPTWESIVNSLDGAALSELACGNTLVAVKPS